MKEAKLKIMAAILEKGLDLIGLGLDYKVSLFSFSCFHNSAPLTSMGFGVFLESPFMHKSPAKSRTFVQRPSVRL